MTWSLMTVRERCQPSAVSNATASYIARPMLAPGEVAALFEDWPRW